MEQKHTGTLLIVIGLILGLIFLGLKVRADDSIQMIINDLGGSCYLSDGTCLHQDRDFTLYILGWIFAAGLCSLGVYLLVFDKTQVKLAENQIKIAEAIKESKINEKFDAFISAFSEGEQKVIKAIKDNEGILQSTLRYKVGMSKSSLSLILKNLESKDIISKEVYKKTHKVYFKKVI